MQHKKPSYPDGAFDSYWFEKNLQGDIVAVYDDLGYKLVSYTYDAWGNCTVAYENGGASTIAANNPFRYRGYYYDTETGFYYLNNRYYDPAIGRFISPDVIDVLTATPMDLTDKNLYAYCDNNPVTRADNGGKAWNYLIGGLVGAVVGGFSAAISGGDWKAIALGAGVGLVGGLIAASGIPAGFQIVAGGLLSGGNNLANQTLIEGKSLEDVDWVDVAIDTAIGVGTSVFAYGVTKNAASAADKMICKGVNKVVKGQQSLLSGSRYGNGAIKRGLSILNSGIKHQNTVRGYSSVIGSITAGILSTIKSFVR